MRHRSTAILLVFVASAFTWGPLTASSGTGARPLRRGAGSSSPQTLLTLPTQIWQFAQDRSQIAWLAPGAQKCAQRLVVRSLRTHRQTSLGQSRLCSSDETPAGLSLANDRVVYALEGQGHTEVDGEVLTVSLRDRHERLALRYAFDYGEDSPVPDLLLRGDGATSIVLATGVPLGEDYGLCPGCNSLWRIDANGRSKRLLRIGPTTTFALGENRIATPGTRSIRLHDLQGRLTRVIRSGGADKLGLSGKIAVEADAVGSVRVYSTSTGLLLWSTHLAGGAVEAVPRLSVAGSRIVYSRGKKIFLADATTRRTRLLAMATSQPAGLSIEGTRVAWAEDVGTYPHIRSRVRAVIVDH